MQEITPSQLAAAMPNVGDTTTLTDSRDGQEYTVAKLADGKYWMTENLNLAGGTALSATNTDVSADYINNFTPVNGLTKSDSTIVLPVSDNSATSFSDDSTAYVYNSGNKTANCTANQPCYSYYSWLAATAGGKNASGSAVISDGYNAAYSICPKGWKLPIATTERVPRHSGGYTGGDFYKMATQYGMTTNNYYEDPDNSPTFLSQAGPGTTPGFLLAGYYGSGSFYSGGSRGYYWSSTSYSTDSAYDLNFGSGYIYSADNNYRRYGFSVRCLFSGQ